MINKEIYEEMKKRGISRLCHFTKSKNFAHIINDFNGIIATDKLPEGYKDINDINRFDKKTDYVCCSVQYPNIYYLDRIKENDILFKDWIILCININAILESEILISKVNAATECGKHIKSGIQAFNEIFDNSIITSKRTIQRPFTMPNNCSTDIQAEILVKNTIDKKYIESIIVPNEIQDKEEFIRMDICGISGIDIIVSEEMFNKSLANSLKYGQLPKEVKYLKV